MKSFKLRERVLAGLEVEAGRARQSRAWMPGSGRSLLVALPLGRSLHINLCPPLQRPAIQTSLQIPHPSSTTVATFEDLIAMTELEPPRKSVELEDSGAHELGTSAASRFNMSQPCAQPVVDLILESSILPWKRSFARFKRGAVSRWPWRWPGSAGRDLYTYSRVHAPVELYN